MIVNSFVHFYLRSSILVCLAHYRFFFTRMHYTNSHLTLIFIQKSIPSFFSKVALQKLRMEFNKIFTR